MYLFLQQGPANTTTYMIAGYAVIFIVMLVYMPVWPSAAET